MNSAVARPVAWPAGIRGSIGDVRRGAAAYFRYPATRRGRLLIVGSLLGYSFLVAGMAYMTMHDGGMGYDSYAYWVAGNNVLAGEPLYWQNTTVDALGAYRYPPLFAQLWAPLTLIPALAFSWIWRVVCLLSLRWLAGSWRNVGLWCLVPFTITELSIANVTFPMAVMTVLALRGRAWMAAWAGALKFGPLLVLPYLWFTRPQWRRSLIAGCLSVAVAMAVSAALSPGDWWLYVQSFTWFSASDMQGLGVVPIVPNGLLDAGIRVAIAVVLMLLAIRRGSDRFAFTASIIAVPVLAIWRLTPLLALPRLPAARSRQRQGPDSPAVPTTTAGQEPG